MILSAFRFWRMMFYNLNPTCAMFCCCAAFLGLVVELERLSYKINCNISIYSMSTCMEREMWMDMCAYFCVLL